MTMQERLNRLYEQYGYRKFKMSRFEDYDLYAQNRDFLRQDRIITFTDADGALKALKPDITLSIMKSNGGDSDKVYYNENVCRESQAAMAQSAVPLLGTDRRESSTPSCSSSRSLAAMPPAYPVRLPSAPTTRWHGMMIEMGLWPTALPTAWADILCFSTLAAIALAMPP